MTNYNEDYQYNSCTSRGICSVDPRTSSLQEILVLYLSLTAYYTLKLNENGINNKDVRNLILNTISVLVSNPEFSENDFKAIVKGFNEVLPIIIKLYENMCEEQGLAPDYLKTPIKFNRPADIVNSIRMGQKEYLKRIQSMSEEMRDLYRIMFVLAKSICINILDLESYGEEEGYTLILRLLNKLNEKNTENELKNFIIDITKSDNKLMRHLFRVRKERYGIQRPKNVSYTTTKGKAILVVGSNIRELEIILEEFKNENVGIYTHDEMMLAHTFPKFEEYKNLKGQYGQGMENCLLDFATFPGPIILTRHSLYNVEHLYRGRLYTTDFAYSKGVISISNNDFSRVREGLEETKGFKTGKKCESEIVGFNYDETVEKIDSQIKSGKYSRIFVIGLNGYTQEDKDYFEKLLKIIPDDIFVVSLSCCAKRSNIICLNACFDAFATVRISENILEKYKLPVTLFFPKCDRHTISKMIYLSSENKADIYVGKCTPITLNPNLIFTLTNVFGIQGLTHPKKDLEKILGKE